VPAILFEYEMNMNPHGQLKGKQWQLSIISQQKRQQYYLCFKEVFRNPLYIVLAVTGFVLFWIMFNVFDQLLFFSPMWSFYIRPDAVKDFIITNITAVLIGIVISINIYVIRNTKLGFNNSLFSGSILSIASSGCASCSSLAVLFVSMFGSMGTEAVGFLTNYQIPLRIISIVILLWGLYSTITKISKPCILPHSESNNLET
jgi:hypothetical protein